MLQTFREGVTCSMPNTMELTFPEIASKLDQNDEYLKKLLGVGVSWDMLAKPFVFSGQRMTAYTANGFFLTMNMVLILDNLEKTLRQYFQDRGNEPFQIQELIEYLTVTVGFVQVQAVDKMQDAVRYILSGPMVLFIDGSNVAVLIDTRIYPMRSISQPEVERVVRGPRDGFIEVMLMNVALIRRRLRDPRLRVELFQIGTRAQTDVSLMYLEDVTNKDLVRDIREKIKSFPLDIAAMGAQSMTEWIGQVKWNPYPIFRLTERPDVATAGLMEGQVVIVVDTTPEVMIGPTTIFHHIHHPDDYHNYPSVGLYMRIASFLGFLFSVFGPSLFIVLAAEHDHLPKSLMFLGTPKPLPLSLGLQFFITQVVIDLFERAVINTPSTLATAISIFAAIIFSQFAVMMNLLSPEALFFVGTAAVAQYATSSRELGSANRVSRLWMIVMAWGLGGKGLVIAAIVWLFVIWRTRAMAVPYLWPVVPFSWRGLKGLFSRNPLYQLGNIANPLRPQRQSSKK